MPPLERQELGSRLLAKFIRVGERVYVGRTIGDNHMQIAQMDGIAKEIEVLKKSDPDNVDGGFITILGSGEIQLIEGSGTFDIPVPKHAQTARIVTADIVSEIFPEHDVKIIESRRKHSG